jgi:hypothetical protein
MARCVNKWLPVVSLASLVAGFLLLVSWAKPLSSHPYYLSVVEVNHNTTDKTLEISCKIFTNDFEETLEKNYKSKIDLASTKDKAVADKWIRDYITKHLSFKADDKSVTFSYLGYEKEDEAIYSYFEVKDIPAIKKISITNSLLHDFSDQQINIIHCIVGGKRQSTKLDYPKTEASFSW